MEHCMKQAKRRKKKQTKKNIPYIPSYHGKESSVNLGFIAYLNGSGAGTVHSDIHQFILGL